MSDSIEPAALTAPANPTDERVALYRALFADPYAAQILRALPPVPPRPTPAEAFRRGFDDVTELLRSAEADGTLDILMSVGGSGPLDDRIRAVRTQAAVLRVVMRETATVPAPAPAPNATPARAPKPAVQRGPRKNIKGSMLAAVHDDSTRLDWSADQWARHLGCAKSTVIESAAWTTLKKMREDDCRFRRG